MQVAEVHFMLIAMQVGRLVIREKTVVYFALSEFLF